MKNKSIIHYKYEKERTRNTQKSKCIVKDEF